MKPLQAALLALVLTPLVHADPAPGARQEGQGQETPPEVKRGNIVMRTPMEKLFEAYGFMHGGRDKLRALRVIRFRWIPHEVTEDGVAREREPMTVTLQLAERNERLVRFDEEIDGHQRTKVSNDLQNVARLWIDGEERQIQEVLAAAQTEARLLFMLFDLLYRPESPDLKSVFEKELKRDGRLYYAANYEFHDSRQLDETFRLFYAQDTGLVERIDLHDKETTTNRRISTFLLSEYLPCGSETPAESIKFPGRVEWKDRAGKTLALWRFVDVELEPELAPGYFAGP